MEKIIEKTAALMAVQAACERSAWMHAVAIYADELLEDLKERIAYEKRLPAPGAELNEWLLDGAENWKQYSWGGCSLIYDCDIAKRVCTPSRLRAVKGGDYAPSRREEWLDVQARALCIAAARVAKCYRAAMRGQEV